tara:strand:+ start:340 stop:549 length:210 start_codon:yes stop_codon:yes gene_type:complete
MRYLKCSILLVERLLKEIPGAELLGIGHLLLFRMFIFREWNLILIYNNDNNPFLSKNESCLASVAQKAG